MTDTASPATALGPAAGPADVAVPDGDHGDAAGSRWALRWTTVRVAAVVVLVAGFSVAVAVAGPLGDTTPAAGSVDVGFAQDMIAHHDQAIQMSLAALATSDDAEVRHFAQEVIVAQRFEIGYMTALLGSWQQPTTSPTGDAMGWMGMATPTANMPGMASADQLAALGSADPATANSLFLELMTEHHRGGVHMADHAATHATDPTMRDLAARMAAAQRAEIVEYSAAAARLDPAR